MPLETGRSREAFSRNVATEMHAGKPQRQALAIAYAQKRRSDAGATRILVEVTDDEDQFANLLLYLKENSDGGHSFKVVVDPDMKENCREFYIDGDGAFRIHSIKEEVTRKDSTISASKIDAAADGIRRLADGVDALEKRFANKIATAPNIEQAHEQSREAMKKLQHKYETIGLSVEEKYRLERLEKKYKNA